MVSTPEDALEAVAAIVRDALIEIARSDLRGGRIRVGDLEAVLSDIKDELRAAGAWED